ncbi:uncharacterized protein LOC144752214 isoform X2 [Lissotriton helveticus]
MAHESCAMEIDTSIQVDTKPAKLDVAGADAICAEVEISNTESWAADQGVVSGVFGSVYSMFDINLSHKGQIQHLVTAEELERRFSEPEKFSLRIAQRYLRQRKDVVSNLADKCSQYNLHPNRNVGMTSAWTLITEGDAKHLAESTEVLAAKYWPSKEIAKDLNTICTASAARTGQLENTRDYLVGLQQTLGEKLERFDLVTHGGGTQFANLFIDCILSTIQEELALRRAQ